MQWGVNRIDEGWLVLLINNKGVTKFTFEDEVFDQAQTSHVKVHLRSTGETCDVVLPPGGIRFVRFPQDSP